MSFFTGKSHSDNDRDRPSPSRSSTTHTYANGNGSGYSQRPSNPRGPSSSFFNTSLGASTSRGIFGGSTGGGGGSSYYKRRPRDGYITYLLHKLQRMIKELWAYARRHPVKAFFAVVVPLLSAGGAIGGLMRQFGVRLPMGGMGMMGGLGGGRGMGGEGFGGGRGGFGGEGMGGGGGWMDGAGSLMQVAKAFM
ncbi:hypothetical protein LTR91_009956 [Friedmanniomyces endolithicus]|uniref:Uncharacterized protein n=1 Tax=Friedmanniomyces endolithicus TaxID=329885 RepID=A0AAN6QTX2_9PEZI|nr:hypothetical protein LTR94_002706 [Friedmanniomyces endolithicus]KAK0794571.1 hypothetical protein LTR59_007756 [Friedmanniomyces endolithicus]KAK0797901.1 hypothetical protein LTR75_009718 [Friedmanniomyces endolithicus]KAK0800635.1 hypothetical protein LTR38_007069 [Friedmanniomyces endolithicus]KAK0849066.1 hypothetical protein LTR03_005391 [Friedmanniomyces endolithicus]